MNLLWTARSITVTIDFMAAAKIPTDLKNPSDEGSSLSYWRGHMDARMDDLGRRVENIESKVTTIHEAVQKIVVSLESKDAAERQTKGIIRWFVPDAAASVAIVIAIIAVALKFIP